MPAEYDFHGAKLTEGVKEVEWSGGKLPDDFYDEFVISTFLTGGLKPDTMLYFPVVQECEQGVSRWIDIPADRGPRPWTASGRRPASRLMPKPCKDGPDDALIAGLATLLWCSALRPARRHMPRWSRPIRATAACGGGAEDGAIAVQRKRDAGGRST